MNTERKYNLWDKILAALIVAMVLGSLLFYSEVNSKMAVYNDREEKRVITDKKENDILVAMLSKLDETRMDVALGQQKVMYLENDIKTNIKNIAINTDNITKLKGL